MKEIGLKLDNTAGTVGQVNADEINSTFQELQNAVLKGGLTLTDSNLTQTAQVMGINAGAASSCVDSGTPNTVILTPTTGTDGLVVPATYASLNGWEVFFYIKETNTGNVTVNIGQSVGGIIGAKKLLQVSEEEIPVGALVSGQGVRARYSPAADAPDGAWIIDASILLKQPAETQSVTGSVAASALTVELKAKNLDFRKTDLTSGIYDKITFPDLELIIPNGATLGTIDTIGSELILIAINNSGTVELAIVNISGGNDLTETDLITTVAVDATADLNNVFYSESARIGVPYRVVGSVRSTQAIAGAWVTAPSLVQGYGGQALAAMSSYGYGQDWYVLTGSRTLGVTYYNDTNKLITVMVTLTQGNYSPSNITVGGKIIAEDNPEVGTSSPFTFPVPVGASYVVASGNAPLLIWSEFR